MNAALKKLKRKLAGQAAHAVLTIVIVAMLIVVALTAKFLIFYTPEDAGIEALSGDRVHGLDRPLFDKVYEATKDKAEPRVQAGASERDPFYRRPRPVILPEPEPAGEEPEPTGEETDVPEETDTAEE